MLREKNLSVDKDVIMAKLSKLKQYLNYLKELRKSSFEDFMGDFKITGTVESDAGAFRR